MKLKIALSGPPHFSPFFSGKIRKAVVTSVAFLPLPIQRKIKQLKKTATLVIALVDTQTMTKLNKKYRHKNKVTDVLTFSRWEQAFAHMPEVSLGDLIICLPVAKQQARRYQSTLGRELERLTVHGILHLFGYDHERSEKDEKIMFRLQDKILKQLSTKHLKT